MISIVCPVYNEEQYIHELLQFCISALPTEKEIILIDGYSTDNTCQIIEQYCLQYNNLKLLHNPHRYVSYALNMGIKAATGNIIIRLDAHTCYAPDYFEKIVAVFNITNADVVGGPMRIAVGNKVQNAIGYATSTLFGIGNSSFHFEAFEGFTNSVYLGAWKKEIFRITGLFDEAFVRNQDDEFNYRARQYGFTIYQSPAIKGYYHPRKTFKELFSQYFQYGYYKPMVLSKIKSGIRLSHFVPAIFIVYLITLPLSASLVGIGASFPLALYLLCNLYFSLAAKKTFIQTIYVCAVYPLLHFAYGSGFIAGVLKPLTYKNKMAAFAQEKSSVTTSL
jgi:succinoglycan biosynthesis protein ExoA